MRSDRPPSAPSGSPLVERERAAAADLSRRSAGFGRRLLSRAPAALLAFARRVADLVPLTALGFAVAALATAALVHYGYGEMDLVLLVLGWGAVGLVGLSLLFVLLAALLVKRRLRAEEALHRDCETGRATPTGFSLPSLGWVPLVRLRWSWLAPPLPIELVREEGRLHERVRPTRRGAHEGVRRRVVVEDVFGLARLGLRMDDPLTLRVLPHGGRLGRLPTLLAYAGGEDWPHPMGLPEGDRVELRRYGPGDPARFIHWSIYARTRKLVVRVPERALSRAHRTAAYLVTGEADEASSGAARVAVESGALGEDWSFGADGAGGTQTVSQAQEALVRSARVPATEGGAGLEGFLREEEKSGPVSVVVFAPAEPGPWIERVLAALGARRGCTRIVIGVDGLAADPPGGWWRRLLARPPAREGASAGALEAALEALASARAEVLVVDRASGRVLGEAHRRAVMRRAKKSGPKTAAEKAA